MGEGRIRTMVVRKYKFTNKEILELTEQLDGYIWVVMDVKKGVIAAGDEYVSDLRDELLISRHSKANDIFGAGLNMRTGEIDYIPAVNRRNPSLDRGELSSEQELRVETVLHYFFENIPPFLAERSGPRYSKKPVKMGL